MATDVQSGSVAETLAPLLRALLGGVPPVRIEFWDGSVIESDGPPGGGGPPGTLRVNSPDAIRRLLWMPNQLGLGRAYVAGDLDADGDFIAMVEALRDVTAEDLRFRGKAVVEAIAAAKRAGVIGRPLPPPPQEARLKGRRHSLRRDSRAISHHYDVGNDFYRIVLGESMTYSCARFVDDDTSLEDAQAAKHDLVARKLGLDQREGMRLLDVGCGWGSMVIHAAARYGADAVGITISREQAELARKRVGEAGVGDKVEIRLQDYRELGDERFDAISSIGMAEHVGAKRIDEYFGDPSRRRSSRPAGCSTTPSRRSAGRSSGGTRSSAATCSPTASCSTSATRCWRWSGPASRSATSSRCASTTPRRCAHWVANLEANWDAAVAAADVAHARIWRLYMAGSAVGFTDGGINIHQVLGVVPTASGESAMPPTRASWV